MQIDSGIYYEKGINRYFYHITVETVTPVIELEVFYGLKEIPNCTGAYKMQSFFAFASLQLFNSYFIE